MALINCPECGKEISDKAASCPNCGVAGFAVRQMTMPGVQSQKKILLGKVLKITGIVTLVIGIICAVYFGGIYYNDYVMRNASDEARNLYRSMIGADWEFFRNPGVFFGWLGGAIVSFSAFFGAGVYIQKHLK